MEVIAARQAHIVRIPLTEVFVPQISKSGYPTRDVPQEEDLPAHASTPEEDLPTHASTPEEGLPTHTSPEPILDVLGQERTQVILGGPGSGKSTLLHYLLLLLCAPAPTGKTLPVHLKHAPIPFLIELRHYALKKAANFIEFLISEARELSGLSIDAESLEALFREEGRAVVFFDGLDEVFDLQARERVMNQFRAFAASYGSVQIIVTSRIAGYQPASLEVGGFQHYTLLDFSVQQIRQFIEKWYTHYTWAGDSRKAEDLFNLIKDNQRLMELAGTPLLLAMMAVMYKYQNLPEKRWELYERCARVLLGEWDIQRKSIDQKILPLGLAISIDQKAEILERISLYMLESERQGRELNAIEYQPLMTILATYLQQEFAKPHGEAWVIAGDILRYLQERTALLAETGQNIFGFVHRTFMEYFAACHCRREFNTREADYDWLCQQIFGRHWQQEHWQEVLLLLTAMLAHQGSPIKKVVETLRSSPGTPPLGLAFAARCLAEAGAVKDRAWAQELLTELVTAIKANAGRVGRREDVFSDEALKAFSALASVVEVAPAAQAIISNLARSNTLLERMAGWQMGLARLSGPARLRFALAALEHQPEAVRRAAIAALEHEWAGDDQVGEQLLALVQADQQLRVRQDAIGALQRGWPKRAAELLSALEQRLPDETSPLYILWLIKQLAAHWQGHQRAWSIVEMLSRWNRVPGRYAEIAKRALEALAFSWPDHPQTLPLLHQRARDSREDVDVRSKALQLIAQGWPRDKDTIPLLQYLANHDPSQHVRGTARLLLQSIRSNV